MGNTLRKDRKEPKLKALSTTKDVAAETLALVFSKDFPKGARIGYGNVLIGNMMRSFEDVRAANRIFADTTADIRKRMSLGLDAEVSMNRAISDLDLMPNVFTVDENGHSSYDKIKARHMELQSKAIESENLIHGWRKSDARRLSATLKKRSHESSFEESNRNDVECPIIFFDKEAGYYEVPIYFEGAEEPISFDM